MRIYNQSEYLLSSICDNFSISMQLYYYDNHKDWEKYSDICVLLISQLQKFDEYESEIKPKLLNLINSVTEDSIYSVWVV